MKRKFFIILMILSVLLVENIIVFLLSIKVKSHFWRTEFEYTYKVSKIDDLIILDNMHQDLQAQKIDKLNKQLIRDITSTIDTIAYTLTEEEKNFLLHNTELFKLKRIDSIIENKYDRLQGHFVNEVILFQQEINNILSSGANDPSGANIHPAPK